MSASRRSFLKELGIGAALLPTVFNSKSESNIDSLESTTYNEPDWQQVRAQFAFPEEKVPMNAANLCPSFRSVANHVSQLTQDIDRDCSGNNRAKFYDLTEVSRRKVALQLGVSADEIALIRNTSEANNVISNGLSLAEGDEIILWDQNHPTNNVAWDVRAARFGLLVKRVSTPKQPRNGQDLVDPFASVISDKTRVLAITHVSNVSGIQLPIRELVDIAHQNDIHVHVDGAQTWGAMDLNLKTLGCDSYSASAHKWYCGPKEAGILYVDENHIPQVWPNIVGSGWGYSVEPKLKGARKFESLGQRDDACLAAVGIAADLHDAIGPSRIATRIKELATYYKEGVSELGAKLVTPLSTELTGGVSIIEVPRKHRQEVSHRMYDEHGIAGSHAGGLRLCPHIYNTYEHVERAIAGVQALSQMITIL